MLEPRFPLGVSRHPRSRAHPFVRGKLARLLLSHSLTKGEQDEETRFHATMTHEEMAQRIGASRETVTRLLSNLRKKRLIRLDGSTLIIRDCNGLKALAV